MIIKLSGAVSCAVVLLAGAPADAYTIENAFAQGCHERITSEALRAVRLELPTAAPLPLTGEDQALTTDLQFTPDGDMKDLGGATLLIAVRDNDLKGRGSSDLTELAEIHGDPGDQMEHCLRGPGQVEPGGSMAALTACRAFIRGRVIDALAGLDAAGKPDPAKRTPLTLHLSVRGTVDAPLPIYYLRIGQAVHALQDSFTHSYRTADGAQTTVVLNWLDYVNKTLVESRDGPPHLTALDVCDDPDELRKHRRELATAASTSLLRITLDPALTNDAKLAAVDALLDGAIAFKPGCTFANQWCAAPEAQYLGASGCGCSSGPVGLLGSLLALVGLAWRGRRPRPSKTIAGLLVIAGALGLGTASARAEEEAVAEHAPPAPVVTPVKESLPADPSQMAFGVFAGVGASFDKPAMAGTAGVRLRLTKRWSLGLDGEWNPWFALNGSTVRSGVVNVYLTAILRFPLAYENFNLRSTASLGGSYLLSNLYGAPSGSIGPYVGISPLGLEWKASKYFYLIINPAGIAMPIPHITGVPFLYPQYRFTIGVELYAG